MEISISYRCMDGGKSTSFSTGLLGYKTWGVGGLEAIVLVPLCIDEEMCC